MVFGFFDGKMEVGKKRFCARGGVEHGEDLKEIFTHVKCIAHIKFSYL